MHLTRFDNRESGEPPARDVIVPARDHKVAAGRVTTHAHALPPSSFTLLTLFHFFFAWHVGSVCEFE